MRLPWREMQFHSLQSRLTAQFSVLFTAALVCLSVALYFAIERIAAAEVEEQLETSGAIYDRLWQERSSHMQDAASLLARDFGFLEALATGDSSTAASALVNLERRLGAKGAFILGADGTATIGDELPDAEQALQLWDGFDSGKLAGVVLIDGPPRQLVAAPIMAPQLLGWIVFVTDIDQAQLQSLEALSPIPFSAGIAIHAEGKRWQNVAGGIHLQSASGGSIESLMKAGGVSLLDTGGELTFHAIKPVPSIIAGDEAALLLQYPRSKAMAAYRPIQWAIGIFAIVGLLLMLLMSSRIAARIVKPIARLDAAAEGLAKGEWLQVEVTGGDEIARLAGRFNAMASEIEEREKHITLLAYSDVLTGLPNRVKFQEVAEERLAGPIDQIEKLALLCLDLDDFKSVNDTLGHSAGDGLLRAITGRIVRHSKDAFVARLGGDEFVVLLDHGGDPAEVDRFAGELVEAIRRPLEVDGHQIVPGTSIGIAMAGRDGFDIDTLLRNANLALYRAKAGGRGHHCFFEESFNERAQQRRKLEADMRQAIEHGEFELYYQPLFDLKNNRIGTFEALIRWNHPERGLVSPDEFIPIAEDTGMIRQIGAWALREACREAVNWPDDIRVAVNVSSVQFQRDGLQKIVLQALAASGLAPHRLEIEITESIFLESNEVILGILHSLRKLGVRIALDDFGTGYSSLSYLQSFPFDKIKIDRSFIQDLLVRPGATAVVRAITDLAAALGMETTAEGVEESDQLDRLRTQGCTSVQGFLFSKPVRSQDIAAMLNPGELIGRKAA